jgi:hypothetical protein
MSALQKFPERDPFHEGGVLGKPYFDADRNGMLVIPWSSGCVRQSFISPWLAPASEHRKSYVADLCAVFATSDLMELEGKEAFALRNFDFLNEPIEGLESLVTGRRFTVMGWARRVGVDDGQNRLEQRRARTRSQIDQLRQRISEEERRLGTLERHYRNWEAP